MRRVSGAGRYFIAVTALLTAAVLTGCGTGAATATTESPSAPSGTQTSTPEAPSPTLTGGIDLSDPSTWLIGFDGVGPLTIGGSVAKEKPSMSFFTDESKPDLCPMAVFEAADTPDLWAMPGPDRDTIASVVVDGKGDPAPLAAGSPKTAKGVGVGATKQQLLAAYPDITQ